MKKTACPGWVRCIIFYCSLVLCISLRAQEPVSNFFRPFLPQLENPAWFGTQEGITAGYSLQTGWRNFSSVEQTYSLFADYPAMENLGTGLIINNQFLGIFQHVRLTAAVNYELKLSLNHFLRAGFSLSVLQSGINWSQVRVAQGEDKLLEQYVDNHWSFQGGMGLLYAWQDRLTAEFAIDGIFRIADPLSQGGTPETPINRSFMFGARYFAKYKEWVFIPDIALHKFTSLPLSPAFGVHFMFKGFITAGLGYRYSNFHFNLGALFFNRASLHYSLGLGTSGQIHALPVLHHLGLSVNLNRRTSLLNFRYHRIPPPPRTFYDADNRERLPASAPHPVSTVVINHEPRDSLKIEDYLQPKAKKVPTFPHIYPPIVDTPSSPFIVVGVSDIDTVEGDTVTPLFSHLIDETLTPQEAEFMQLSDDEIFARLAESEQVFPKAARTIARLIRENKPIERKKIILASFTREVSARKIANRLKKISGLNIQVVKEQGYNHVFYGSSKNPRILAAKLHSLSTHSSVVEKVDRKDVWSY